jgi:hypothetical protein
MDKSEPPPGPRHHTRAVSAERGYGDLVDRGADGDTSGPVGGPRDLPRRHPPERGQERPSMDGLSCRAERQGIHLRPRSPCPLNKEWRPRRPFPPGTAPTDLRPIRRLGAPTVIVDLACCDGLVTSARIFRNSDLRGISALPEVACAPAIMCNLQCSSHSSRWCLCSRPRVRSPTAPGHERLRGANCRPCRRPAGQPPTARPIAPKALKVRNSRGLAGSHISL